VAAALLVALLASSAGCDDDDGSPDGSAEPAACGLLSEDTLQTLVGEAEVTTMGRMVSAEQRQLSGLKCQVVDAATAGPLLQINVVDAASDDDARSQADLVANEGRSVRRCVQRSSLPDGGYLCARPDETVAAAAMPDRLIRLVASGDAQDNLTEANAPDLFDEIDSHVERYDESQGS
jgi:hypothetical protein